MSINNFSELQIAYTKTFNNASDLLEESSILLKQDRYAKAYLLSHIGIEELARCIMLASAVTKFRIKALDAKKLNRRPKQKIQLAYSFIEKLKGYTRPLSKLDRIEIITSFFSVNSTNIIFDETIQKLDNLKNASFYVDQYQNVTKTPKEVISDKAASDLLSSALLLKEFFEYSKWHEEENLIALIKGLDNENLLFIKSFFSGLYGDKEKI